MTRLRVAGWLVILAGAALGACRLASAVEIPPHRQLTPQALGDTVAFTNVRLIRMATNAVEESMTVVTAGGRIIAIGPTSTTSVPAGASVVDGAGRYLIPGLADMHVHVGSGHLGQYVQYGVTSVRNMWGYENLRLAPRGRDGALLPERDGPSVYSASPGLDGTPPAWPSSIILDDPRLADTVVASLARDGWPFLKVYNSLSLATYDSIAASARRHGVPFVGHVPFAVPVQHALEQGQRSIEHLTGYDRLFSHGLRGAYAWANADLSSAATLARLTRDAGTWNCPTQAILENLLGSADRNTHATATLRRHAFVRALHDAGAPLLAGTDAGIGRTEPGTSLHDELAQFVASGLSPYEALRTATVDAAEFLGRGGEFGTIAIGGRADLVLLARNPLADVTSTRAIEGVLLRGRWFAPE